MLNFDEKPPIEIYIVEIEGRNKKVPIMCFYYSGTPPSILGISDKIFFDRATLENSKGTKVNFSFEKDKIVVDTFSTEIGNYVQKALTEEEAESVLDLIHSNEGDITLTLWKKTLLKSHSKEYTLSGSTIKSLVEALSSYK